MKRVGYLVEKIADRDNLLLAFYKAKRGKQYKKEVISFGDNLEYNITKLQNEIISGRVSVGKYHSFVITDPKKRNIYAASFDERVLHHAIMIVCHQYFERNLIETTYATRIDKGVYKALDKAIYASKKYNYVAKLDFKKYFDSISHQILKEKLERIFKDKRLLYIFSQIIDTYSVNEGSGIPIGNLTSQYFANYYLSSLDHYIKEDLKIPVYVRYMDDMLLFDNDRANLRRSVNLIKKYSTDKLELLLKTPIIKRTSDTVSFLGYKIGCNMVLLNSRSRNRFSKKILKYDKLLLNGVWNEKEYQLHILPLMSFVRYAYTKKMRKRILCRIKSEERL
ncbi:MAG: hypothetical protein IJZ87_06555 [Bacteroidales bacterium]|nr:hypothetical protein [Bacteroidales bacterium]